MATTSRLSAPPKLSEASERFQDPIVAEVRAARKQLSARFHDNLALIGKDLMKRQSALGTKLRRFK